MIAMLALTMLLCSCGQVEEVVEDEPEPVCEAAKVVKIGFLGPVSGTDSAEGAAARNAFLLAIDKANASGKFPYIIDTIVMDDQSSENVAMAGAQHIVDDPLIVAVAGFWRSGPAASAIPVFKEAEIPLLIWGATREDLTNPDNMPYIMRSAPTHKQENIPLAAMVVDGLGYQDWFLVADDEAYGTGNLEAFTAELTARDITPLGFAQVSKDNPDDLRFVAQRIKHSGARSVYCGSAGDIGSELKHQLFEVGINNILFCGVSGMDRNEFRLLSVQEAEGVLAISPGVVLEQTAAGLKFIEDYKACDFTEPLGNFTAYAYDAALILLNALSACGDAPTAAMMTEAIFSSVTTGLMGTTTFDEIGQTRNIPAYLNVIQDSTWMRFNDSKYASGERRLGGR